MLIGITGGIGGGKTTFAQLLKNKNYMVLDTDAYARKLQNEDTEIRTKIIDLFGHESYEGKILNRKFVADIVFKNSTLLLELNNIIHPAVKKEIVQWASRNQDEKVLFIESAILFEGSFDKLVDKIVLITAGLETRIDRVMKRDNVSREQVISRINNQMSDDDKMKLVDYIIRTDDNTPLSIKVEEFLSIIIA